MLQQNKLLLLFLVTSACVVLEASIEPMRGVICASVADLRSSMDRVPAGLKAPALSKDIGGQIAQLCLGESVLIEQTGESASEDEWVKISAIEQQIFSKDGWIGCPGFVDKEKVMPVDKFPRYTVALQALWTQLYQEQNAASACCFVCPCGTLLEAYKIDEQWWQVKLGHKCIGYIPDSQSIYPLEERISESEESLRSKFLLLARSFVNTPYVWGGRSPGWGNDHSQPPCIAGTDCSSLVNMLFRALWLQVPENSVSQYIAAPIKIEKGSDGNTCTSGEDPGRYRERAAVEKE